MIVIKAANDAGIFAFGYQNSRAPDQTLEHADAIIAHCSELKKYV